MECACKSEGHNDEHAAMKRMEKVLYQRVDPCDEEGEGMVYIAENELVDFDDELIAVYTLSHFARLQTEPKRVTLRIVAIE